MCMSINKHTAYTFTYVGSCEIVDDQIDSCGLADRHRNDDASKIDSKL